MPAFFNYLLIFVAAIGGAWLLFFVLSRLPLGPVIYFNQSNGRSFALPLIPGFVFLVICVVFIYFFLR